MVMAPDRYTSTHAPSHSTRKEKPELLIGRSQSTREHVSKVADEMEARGFQITGGGNRFPEEYIPGPGGARRGSAFPDITATKNGRTVRVNTIDTCVNGITPTAREARNAAKIRRAMPNDHLILIPKPRH
jgi:hypothetical protein